MSIKTSIEKYIIVHRELNNMLNNVRACITMDQERTWDDHIINFSLFHALFVQFIRIERK